MNILDDLEKIKKLDSEDMLGIEENFYNQLLEAKKIAEKVNVESIESAAFSGVAILGMGGSGFTGDIIRNLTKGDISVPVEVVKSYDLPGFINSSWLVVPVSYSGNTEETLSAVQQALSRGCNLLCVTSGGELEKIAEDNGSCIVKVPSGYQPRGAAGYLFFSTILVLKFLKIISLPDSDTEEALELIKKKCIQYRREIKTQINYAKIIAAAIGDGFPVIYGTEGILSSVAFRWKCEINENSKTPCFWSELPELNHNEIVGWERLKGITSRFVLIVLVDKQEQERIKVRIRTTIKLIRDNFSKIIEIPVEGKSKLAKALSTMYTGDIVSVYLALLNGINPTPVKKIVILKAELAKLNKK